MPWHDAHYPLKMRRPADRSADAVAGGVSAERLAAIATTNGYLRFFACAAVRFAAQRFFIFSASRLRPAAVNPPRFWGGVTSLIAAQRAL